MSGAVETCRITGTLFLHDGSPAAGLRVEVRESALPGTPTANRQQVHYCDAAGYLDFPAIQLSDIRVFAQARGFDLDCEGVWLHVPDADITEIGSMIPPEGFDPPTHVIVTIPQGVTSYNTRTGAITSVSSDVTNALGYIPASREYVDNSGVVSLNGRDGAVALVSSDVTNALGYTPATLSHTHPLFDLTTPGFVPAPTVAVGKFLSDDGTWQAVTAGPGGGVSSVFARTGIVVAESAD